MDPLLIFGWGLLGGVIPEVIRIYEILREGGDFYYSKKFLIITCLLALSSGAIAVAFDASNPRSAILIGFATPTIVSKYAGRSPIE